MCFLGWNTLNGKSEEKCLRCFDMNYVGFVYKLYIISEFLTIQTEFNENWESKSHELLFAISLIDKINRIWTALEIRSFLILKASKKTIFYEKRNRKFSHRFNQFVGIMRKLKKYKVFIIFFEKEKLALFYGQTNLT